MTVDPYRRTGRTHHQVEALAIKARAGAGCLYVVNSTGMVGYVLDMIRQHFGEGLESVSQARGQANYASGGFVRVLAPSNADQLLGLPVIEYDHAIAYQPPPEPSKAENRPKHLNPRGDRDGK